MTEILPTQSHSGLEVIQGSIVGRIQDLLQLKSPDPSQIWELVQLHLYHCIQSTEEQYYHGHIQYLMFVTLKVFYFQECKEVETLFGDDPTLQEFVRLVQIVTEDPEDLKCLEAFLEMKPGQYNWKLFEQDLFLNRAWTLYKGYIESLEMLLYA